MTSQEPIGITLVVFSVLTTLTNLILMITILCTRPLRLSSKYILVFVFCICDLITGLFQYTIYADKIFKMKYVIDDCNLAAAYSIFVPYILDTLRMSLMIALLVDFSLRLMIRDAKLLIKISLSMIACSIVASFVLVFPMVTRGTDGCVLIYAANYRGLNVSTYFPQMVVIVFLGVTIAYVYLKHRTRLPNFDPAQPPASPIDIMIAASVMVWFSFPIMVYLVSPDKCILNCDIDMEALGNCLRFFYRSKTFVVPLVWLCSFQVRNHLKDCRCLRRNQTNLNMELNHMQA